MPDRITKAQYDAMVADQMSEDALQAQIMALAFDLGWLAYHTHDSRRSNPGWPDLALCHPKRGRFMVRELKKSNGRVTPEQRKWIHALGESGIDVGVWRPAELLDGTVLAELTA